ncbi:MAG TPA: hypothetical protein VGM73_17515 [Candidatus Didemnitutus sp.]|jgi:hypothetical protein
MDESLKELEDELSRLHPARPSLAVAARIEAELALGESRTAAPQPGASVANRTRRLAWSLCVAAAAAAVTFVALRQSPSVAPLPDHANSVTRPSGAVTTSQPPLSPDDAEYRPVDARSVFYGVSAETGVYLRDQTPVQQVRYRYLDTYTWKNQATHASLQWTVPRDEIRVIPAILH